MSHISCWRSCWWQIRQWRFSRNSSLHHCRFRPWWPVGHHGPTRWSQLLSLRVWGAACPILPSAHSTGHSYSGYMSPILLLRIVVDGTGRGRISSLGVRAAGTRCYSRGETTRQTCLCHPLQWWGLRLKWKYLYFWNLSTQKEWISFKQLKEKKIKKKQ